MNNERINYLKASIEYEQRRIRKEQRQGITVNITNRLNTINKLEKELAELT